MHIATYIIIATKKEKILFKWKVFLFLAYLKKRMSNNSFFKCLHEKSYTYRNVYTMTFNKQVHYITRFYFFLFLGRKYYFLIGYV